MLSEKVKNNTTCTEVVDKIRHEIIQRLKEKGVTFSDIDIDFRQENVSFKLSGGFVCNLGYKKMRGRKNIGEH